VSRLQHLNVDLFLMVVKGLLPPRMLALQLLEHLREICPECRATIQFIGDAAEQIFEASTPSSSEPAALVDPRYSSLVSRAGKQALAWAREVEHERRLAENDLVALLRLPKQARRDRVIRARTHFRSRVFAELLVEQTATCVRTDPGEAAELAELVPLVLDRIPGAGGHGWVDDLKTRARAHLANVRRVAGDLEEANRLFLEVRARLANASSNDGELHAEINRLEASLRLDQRRLEEAEQLFDRAMLLYRQQGDNENLARTLTQRGDVRRMRGDLAGAVEDLGAASDLLSLEPSAERHLQVCVLSNLALCLCDLGRAGEARTLIDENRHLYKAGGSPWERSRLVWLEGIIARGLGEFDHAQRFLLRSRNLFLDKNLYFDAALVSLDLALLYLEHKKHSELKRISQLIAPILRSRGLNSEATAALLLFQRAAAAEVVTAEALIGLRTYLEGARRNPGLRFKAPARWQAS
jgi:tetratricopeptide (TPR) repeat protein